MRFASTYVMRLMATCFVATGVGCTSSTSGSNPGIDGTWDVVSYAGRDLGPSSVTVGGGRLTGTIAFAGDKECARRLEFAIEGDAMSGSSTGVGCGNENTYTVVGKRTKADPPSDTPWNGIWHLQGESTEGDIEISGLTATSGRDFKLGVAGGIATAAGASRYSFVARRR